MSYLNDFPHTRNYDSDLGFLIHEYKKMYRKMLELQDIYDAIMEKLSEIITNAIKNGDIYLTTVYTAETKNLKFYFTEKIEEVV